LSVQPELGVRQTVLRDSQPCRGRGLARGAELVHPVPARDVGGLRACLRANAAAEQTGAALGFNEAEVHRPSGGLASLTCEKIP
jgi:hypothetical protein